MTQEGRAGHKAGGRGGLTAAGVTAVGVLLLFATLWWCDPQAAGVPGTPAVAVLQLDGEVASTGNGGRHPLVAGGRIYVGETVETGTDGSVVLVTVERGARVELGPKTGLRFTAPGELRLGEGQVSLDVGTGPLLWVVTPHGSFRVGDAALALDVSPRGTRVQVTRGAALVVRADGRRATLDAGTATFVAADPPLQASAGPR